MVFVLFFFFKQKTAYEMRISDWSSDVCSSDLFPGLAQTRSADQAREMIMPLIAAPLTRKGKKGSIPLDIGLSSEAPVVGGVVGPLGPAGTLGDAFSGAALADAAAGGETLAERPQERGHPRPEERRGGKAWAHRSTSRGVPR